MKHIDEKHPKKRSRAKIWGIIFLLLFAIGFGTIGIITFRSAYTQRKSCSAEAEGRITEYRTHFSYRHKKTYCPIVEFQAGNEKITGSSHTWSFPKPFKIGTYVTIGYNPANPTEFYVKGYDLQVSYTLGMLFLIIGLAMIAIVILWLLLNKIEISTEKREKIQGFLIMFSIIGFIFIVFLFVAGIVATLSVFTAMGLFALYGHHKNKQLKK